jgi:hypothetical protein
MQRECRQSLFRFIFCGIRSRNLSCILPDVRFLAATSREFTVPQRALLRFTCIKPVSLSGLVVQSAQRRLNVSSLSQTHAASLDAPALPLPRS